MQQEDKPPQAPPQHDFSDILGQLAQADTAQAGLDFSDLLGAKPPKRAAPAIPAAPVDVTSTGPRGPEGVAAIGGEYVPYGSVSHGALVEPEYEPPSIGAAPSALEQAGRELLAVPKTAFDVARHPIRTIMDAVTMPFKQAYDALAIGEGDPNPGLMRAERAYARANNTLSPEMEQHFQRYEASEEGRRGVLAFAAAGLVGGAAGKALLGGFPAETPFAVLSSHLGGTFAGVASYPLLAHVPGTELPSAGKAAGMAIAALPLGAWASLGGIRELRIRDAADAIAQLRQAAPLEINDEPPSRPTQAPQAVAPEIGQAALDARAAAKKLSELDPANVHRSMWNSLMTLSANEQMVVPGVEKESFFRGLQSWPKSLDYAVHERPDGKIDVVAFGAESILQDDVYKKQFETHGFIEGQEVQWRGQAVEIKDLSAKGPRPETYKVTTGMALIRLADGAEHAVPLEELERPPYTELYSPLPKELGLSEGIPPDRWTEAQYLLDDAESRGVDPAKHIMATFNTDPKRLTITEHEAKQIISDIVAARLESEAGDFLTNDVNAIIADEWNKRLATPEELLRIRMPKPPVAKEGILSDVDLLANHWYDFYNIWSKFDDFRAMEKEFGKTKLGQLLGGDKEIPLPDISDIKERYPEAFERALSYEDPNESLAAFSDALSSQVESREISPEIAESLGGRMQGYLDARMQNELATSFDARVRAWMRLRNVPMDQFNGYYRYFANHLGRALTVSSLTPTEYSWFNGVVEKVVKEEQSLDELAASNGYTLDPSPTGYFIREAKSGELLAHAATPDEARGFINGSGASQGPSLDGGGKDNTVPPGAIGGAAQPPSGSPPPGFNTADDELHAPYKPQSGWLQKIFDAGRIVAHRLVKREAVFDALDNKYGTKLGEQFFRPLQRAAGAMLAKLEPWKDDLLTVQDALKDATKEQREQVFEALQTMSPEELESGGFARPYTSQELNLSKLIASMKIDMPKVFKYLRAVDDARGSFQGPELDSTLRDIGQAFNLDADHVRAASIFTFIKSLNINKVSLGMVTRMADAIMRDTPSRQRYMAQNAFTPEMREAVDRLDSFFEKLGVEGGINPKTIINGYVPHYKLNPDAPSVSSAFFFQRGWDSQPEAKFINEMVRTGELDMLERDPLIAAYRYARALARKVDFNPVYKQAMEDAQNEWNKMPSTVRNKAFSIITSYADEMKGRPDAALTFTQDVVDKTMEELHLNIEPNVRRDLVDTFASLIYTSGIGFRPGITIRHINQFLTLGGSRFGFERLGDAIGWVARGLKDYDLVRDLRAKGVIPTLSPSPFMTKEELDATGLGRYIDNLEGWAQKVATISMTANGLKSVFELSHFAWYMEARGRALREFSKFSPEVTLAERTAAYKSLALDTFSPAFQKEIDGLVRGGNFAEAADRVGRQTGREVTFVYGLANHPMGWGTNVGRLFGIYGIWPTWMQDYSLSMMSRGNWQRRAATIARFTAMQGAMSVAGSAMGLNMSYLMMGPGFFFDGPYSGAFHTLAPGLLESYGGPVFGLINAAAQAVKEPNPNLRSMYRKRLMTMLLTMGIPARGLFNDFYQASNDPRVRTTIQFWARLAGIKPEDYGIFH